MGLPISLMKVMYQKPRGCGTESQTESPEKEQMFSVLQHEFLISERTAGVRDKVQIS